MTLCLHDLLFIISQSLFLCIRLYFRRQLLYFLLLLGLLGLLNSSSSVVPSKIPPNINCNFRQVAGNARKRSAFLGSLLFIASKQIFDRNLEGILLLEEISFD